MTFVHISANGEDVGTLRFKEVPPTHVVPDDFLLSGQSLLRSESVPTPPKHIVEYRLGDATCKLHPVFSSKEGWQFWVYTQSTNTQDFRRMVEFVNSVLGIKTHIVLTPSPSSLLRRLVRGICSILTGVVIQEIRIAPNNFELEDDERVEAIT